MNKSSLILATAVILSLLIRLYPTITSRMPFSTDAWPLLSNSEKLLKHTPINLEDSVFDGYNNYWPASQIFGVISSIILNVSVMDSMRILFPSLAAFTPVFLYILVEKITGRREAALISSLLTALGGYQAIFTAGVTKETFTLPILLTCLTLATCIDNSVGKNILPFTITAVALVAGHHLQYFLLLIVFSNILILRMFMRGVESNDTIKLSIFLITLLILGITYYPLYALRGITTTLGIPDIISLTSFQILCLLPSYYSLVGSKPKRLPLSLVMIWLTSYVILMINQFQPILLGSPKIPLSLFIQLSILFTLGFYVILGFYYSIGRGVLGRIYYAVGWLSALIGLEAYSIFGAQPSISLTLLYRFANHLLVPASIFASLGLVKIFNSFKKKAYGIICLTLLMLPISLSMVYQHYSSTILEENYLGYQWMYNVMEYESADLLSKYINDMKVCGDMKIEYLLAGYFRVDVDVTGGFKILNSGSFPHECLLVTYETMEKNGYVLGPYGVELKQDWIQNIQDRADRIFSNNFTDTYYVVQS